MYEQRSNDDLLTVDELAQWLGWSRWGVYKSYERLGIPHLRVGTSVRFRTGAVREWIAAQESHSATGPAA